jgi:hypothetical protein
MSFDRGVLEPVADSNHRWLNQLSHAHDNVVSFPDDTQHRRDPAPATQAALPHAAVPVEMGWPAPGALTYAEIRRRAQATRAAYLTALGRHIVAPFKSVPDQAVASMLITARVSSSRAFVWNRPEVFGCAALVGLFLALVGGTTINSMGASQCRAEPGTLVFGADVEATMTVSHGSPCAIWIKAENTSLDELKVTSLPQHGTISLRGRTGVIYRPYREFTGEDFFLFTLRGSSAMRDKASLVRVRVSVK